MEKHRWHKWLLGYRHTGAIQVIYVVYLYGKYSQTKSWRQGNSPWTLAVHWPDSYRCLMSLHPCTSDVAHHWHVVLGCSSLVRGPACWVAVPFTLWNQFFIFLRRLVRDLPKVSRGELNCCKFGGRLPPEISVAFWMSWATVSKTAALACLVGATLYEM